MGLLDVGLEYEFCGVCPHGHRSYLRLRVIDTPLEELMGVCPRCGMPATLELIGRVRP